MNIFRRNSRNGKGKDPLKTQCEKMMNEGTEALDEIDRKLENGELDPCPHDMPKDFVKRVMEQIQLTGKR